MSQPSIPHVNDPAVADAVKAGRVRARLRGKWAGTLDGVSDADVVRLVAVVEAGWAERWPLGGVAVLVAGCVAFVVQVLGLPGAWPVAAGVVGGLLAFAVWRVTQAVRRARRGPVARLAREQGVPPRLPTAEVLGRLAVTQATRRLERADRDRDGWRTVFWRNVRGAAGVVGGLGALLISSAVLLGLVFYAGPREVATPGAGDETRGLPVWMELAVRLSVFGVFVGGSRLAVWAAATLWAWRARRELDRLAGAGVEPCWFCSADRGGDGPCDACGAADPAGVAGTAAVAVVEDVAEPRGPVASAVGAAQERALGRELRQRYGEAAAAFDDVTLARLDAVATAERQTRPDALSRALRFPEMGYFVLMMVSLVLFGALAWAVGELLGGNRGKEGPLSVLVVQGLMICGGMFVLPTVYAWIDYDHDGRSTLRMLAERTAAVVRGEPARPPRPAERVVRRAIANARKRHHLSRLPNVESFCWWCAQPLPAEGAACRSCDLADDATGHTAVPANLAA